MYAMGVARHDALTHVRPKYFQKCAISLERDVIHAVVDDFFQIWHAFAS